ncbi:GNAT family N-acetyltransferase [Phyllobacterium myrsinacearum]|uniref:Ribosomal protein S18 acetylase RimI-like enzyme n=1 Tax=Phyllobacterium myrsinacearum TaxID=28101 RepID=A0A839EGI3_9HYPH|nr:GNAT family N-acetyltransferase [Phyllobacterium myrsinacearum]MBA8877405.1 ribosomal protein S18 acetylase RimI-like enzyme [Phyllobacterium myrsinacearum]
MSVDIRKACPADLTAVKAIVDAAYIHYIARIGCKPGPMLDDYSALISDQYVHVVDEFGEIFGIIVLIPEADYLLLDNVAVAPKAQGRGFGRLLLNFAEGAARNMGYSRIRLYTNELMTENIKLYSSLGYCETDRREEKGLRRVFMTKQLVS